MTRDHAAAQMPGWMLRDHANLADAYKQHIHDGGESALGDFLRDEAARREAEGFVPEAARQAVAVAAGLTSAPPMSDAPPPPAPDDLVRGLRDRARHARAEGNATATSDAWHFEQAADAIEALRAERDAANKYADGLASTLFNTRRSRDDAKADAKRLREALVRIDALVPEGEIFALSEGPVRNLVLRMGEIARDALAQGGNDG